MEEVLGPGCDGHKRRHMLYFQTGKKGRRNMPTVLRIGRFRFHFYSDERDEPAHIHVATADGECKYWLDPIALAGNRGLRSETVRQIERLIYQHATYLRNQYHERHTG
jgi:hypothetical protein